LLIFIEGGDVHYKLSTAILCRKIAYFLSKARCVC